MANDLKVPRRNNRMISLLTQTFSKFEFLRHFRSIEPWLRQRGNPLFIRYSCPYCLFFLLQLVLTLQNALVAADWSQRNFKVLLPDITGQRDYWRAVLTVLPNHRWPGNFCKALFVWRTHLNIQWLTCLPYMGPVVPISCFMLILVVMIVLLELSLTWLLAFFFVLFSVFCVFCFRFLYFVVCVVVFNWTLLIQSYYY